MAEQPNQKRKVIQRKEVTVSLPVVKAPSWLQGFLDFVREQGVVGLAVGLILGAAGKSLIDSLVKNVFSPVVGLIGTGGDLTTKQICLKSVAGQCTNQIHYGLFINDIISFIIVAFAVYFLVKGLKLDKLDKKKY